MLKYFTLLILSFVPFHSCTTIHKMSDNEKKDGHYQLYTYPDQLPAQSFDTDRFKKIVFVALNNLEGQTRPKIISLPNRYKERRILKIGGISGLKSYLDIFKKNYPDNLVLIDSGSTINKKISPKKIHFLKRYLKIDVSNLATQEMAQREGKNYFKHAQKSRPPLLASNLFDLTEVEKIRWRGVSHYYIKEVNKIKIGFINILLPHTRNQISPLKMTKIYIQKPAKTIIKLSRKLKKRGAKIIALNINAGLDCTSKPAKLKEISSYKVNFDTHRSAHCFSQKNVFQKILKKLPRGLVDIIFSVDGKSKVANFIQGYPVIQNPGRGQFLSWAEIYYDNKHQIVNSDMTKIRQPVQICHQFLKKSQDCYEHEDLEGLELLPASFLGSPIRINELPTVLSTN